MRHGTRLTALERRCAAAMQPRSIWIFYDPQTAQGIADTTNARNARTGEVRPIAELPADCTRIVISYDRDWRGTYAGDDGGESLTPPLT